MVSTPPIEIRLLTALSYLVLSIIGIIPNILLAVVLYRSLNKLNQANFFILAAQVLICDLGQLLAQVIVAFPLSLYGSNVYEGQWTIWIYTAVNVVDTISYNGILWFTFTIAVNRFTVFARPVLHNALFTRSKIWRTVAVVWCIVLGQVTGANLLQCWKQFSYNDFYFYIRCQDPSFWLSFAWLQMMRYESYVIPVLMFLLYIYLFFFLRLALSKSRTITWTSSTRQRQIEINILSQAVISTLFLELQTASFTVFPKIAVGFDKHFMSLVQNVISILNNSINPFVYFIINSQIRNEMTAMLYTKK